MRAVKMLKGSECQSYQLTLPFGVMQLDKTLKLENYHHIREWNCSKSGVGLVNEILTGFSAGFERFHYLKYFEALSCLLANLFYASKHGKGVLYSRRRTSQGYAINIPLIDYLAQIGLIDSVIQPSNANGCSSYVIALPELDRKLKVHKARIARGGNNKAVVLRDSSGKDLSIARLEAREPRKMQEIKKAVGYHNSWWDHNLATVDKKPLVPFLHRVFNKSLELGGRFYGGYQSTPSNDRERILFNGKQTVELDYSGLHIAILYAWAGVEMIGDAYTINKFDRNVAKAIMLRLVNCESIGALKANITNSSKPKRKEEYKRYKQAREVFSARAAKGLVATKPRKPKWFDSHITGIPDRFDSSGFIDALNERHSAISHLLGSNDIGLRLQAADSALMSELLTDLYSRKNPVPVLPVHDSLICRKSNSELVRLTMQHHFKAMFNAKIAIK